MNKDDGVPPKEWHARFSERATEVGPERVGAGAVESGWLPLDDGSSRESAGPPPEERSQPSPPRQLRGRVVLWVAIIYALLCLAGVYADSRLLARFDVAYLDYVGIEDVLTGIGSFARLALTPSFILTFVGVAAVAALVVVGLSYVAGRRNSRLAGRALVRRPYWTLVFASLAAIAAINVSLLAEERDVLAFATSADRDAEVDSTYDYDVVSVQADQKAWDRLVNLRSNSHFEFFYDLATKEPVVLAKADISDIAVRSAGSHVIAAATASTNADTVDEAGGRTAQVAAVTASSAAAEGARDAGGSSPREALPMATIPAAAGSDPNVPTSRARYDVAQAQVPVQGKPGERPAGVAGEQLATIETNVERSRDSIDGLKSHLMQVETTVTKMREFIDDLDGAISGIDSAFTGLEAALAKTADTSAYANCPELVLDPPIRFEEGRARLTLESIGLMFQRRAQLVAERSPDQEEWLVVEGQWGGAGADAAAQSLAAQRADVVRTFLNAELGLPEDSITVAAAESTAPIDAEVRLFDCLRRRPVSGTAEQGPSREPQAIATASAAEANDAGSIRPAAFRDQGAVPAAQAPADQPAPPAGDQVAVAAEPEPVGARQEPVAVEPEPEPVAAEAEPVAVEPAAGGDQMAALEDRAPTVGEPASAAGTLPARLDLRDTERGRLLTVSGLFASSSTDLDASARSLLDRVGEILVGDPSRDVAVIGHTDSTGDADSNLALSERRATVVRQYLLQQFELEPDRVRASGWGENVPVASNATPEGRAANRRIEVMIFN